MVEELQHLTTTIPTSTQSQFDVLLEEIQKIKTYFDEDGNGKFSLKEIQNALKNPIGKRYFLVFLVVLFNILIAIIQFYWLEADINVNTLITLIFSVSGVLFGGYVENANQSIIEVKDAKIEELKEDITTLSRKITQLEADKEVLNSKLYQFEN